MYLEFVITTRFGLNAYKNKFNTFKYNKHLILRFKRYRLQVTDIGLDYIVV